MIWRRIRAALRQQPSDRELQAEIQDHIQLLAARNRERGMHPDAALAAARRQFGNTTQLEEDRWSMQTIPAIESLRADVRYAARAMRKNPGFTAGAVLTLALGIGANTAIFSVCHAVLLKPLPYAEPGRLVMLWEHSNGKEGTVAPANFVDWRAAARSFTDVAAINPNSSFILGTQGGAARLPGAGVSAGFFSLLGVRFTLGRNFLPEEDQPGSRVVILSHRAWQEQFGADPEITSRHVILNDTSYTVAGVLPADFRFGSSASDFAPRRQFDIFTPLALDLQKLQRGTHPLRVVARLKPGQDLARAQTELSRIGANLARQYPEDNRGKDILAVPIEEQVTANVRVALETLLAAVGLVLLIACANVANLLLSRAAARRKEIAVRVALGASRGRLAQQLLAESLLLASIGGVLGLGLAAIALAALTPRLPADLARAAGITVDVRMFLFTAVVSLATGVLFGLAPLFAARRMQAGESLRQSERASGTIPAGLRNGLAVAQIAFAVMLLIGAGLMARSFWTLVHVPPGFRAAGIVTAQLSMPKLRYPDNQKVAAFQRELLERLRGRPGIQSAGFTTYLPLSGSDNGWAVFIEGAAPLPVGVYNMAKYRPVSEGYFETIGIPLLRGRTFTSADRKESPWVVVINQAMEREYWGGADAVGKRLHFAGNTWRTVIGVVGDVRHEALDAGLKPEMYLPVEQAPNPQTGPVLVLRTPLDTGAAAAEVRRAVAAMDRALPVDRIETMEQLVSGSVAPARFRTTILAAFSLLALAMASIGIYGVMNYLVIQRTREFGIRLSIGATRNDVLRLVLGKAAVLIVTGTCLGLAGTLLLVKSIEKLLFGTAPLDPVTFLTVPLLLAAVALAASYVPARRATRVDPMVALRYE